MKLIPISTAKVENFNGAISSAEAKGIQVAYDRNGGLLRGDGTLFIRTRSIQLSCAGRRQHDVVGKGCDRFTKR